MHSCFLWGPFLNYAGWNEIIHAILLRISAKQSWGKFFLLNLQIHIILNDILTFLALNDLCFALIHQTKIAFVLARTNNWRLNTEGHCTYLN